MVIPIPVGDDLRLRGRAVFTWSLALVSLGLFISSRYFGGPLAMWMKENCAVVPADVIRAWAALVQEPALLWQSPLEVLRRLGAPALGHLLVHAHEVQMGLVLLYLLLFGRPLEKRLGPWRYVPFFLLSGLLAMVAHILVRGGVETPMVGMTGAVAGVLGGFLVVHPKAHMRLVLWLVLLFRAEIPAFLLVVLWFLLQFGVDQEYLTSLARCQGMAWVAQAIGAAGGALCVLPFLVKLRPPPQGRKGGKGR